MLGFGLVAISGPENIFVRTFSGDTARARLLRYFLPMTVIGVLVQGFLSDTITGTFGIEHTLADALFSLAFAILMSGVVVQLLNVMLRRADRAETERKRVEGELRRTSKFPLENPNPILRIGGDGSILFANRASAAILTAWDRQTGEKIPEIGNSTSKLPLSRGCIKKLQLTATVRFSRASWCPIWMKGTSTFMEATIPSASGRMKPCVGARKSSAISSTILKLACL